MLTDKSVPLWEQFRSEFPNTQKHQWEKFMQLEMDRCNMGEDGQEDSARTLQRWASEGLETSRRCGIRDLTGIPTMTVTMYMLPAAWARLVGWQQAVRERLQKLSDELR